jgi:spore coat protein CotH
MKDKLYFLLLIAISTIAGAKAPKKDFQFGEQFFTKDTVHTIRINFIECNYWDSLKMGKKIQDSLNITTYLQGNVTIDGKKLYSCGVRFKGESSYEFYPGDKKSFRIKFNKFIKDQMYMGLEDINLNNNFKDPTMLREKIYLDLLKKYNCPAPRASYAKVFVNDKFLGLYLVTDNIGDSFLKRFFKTDKGSLFQGEPLANFEYISNNQVDYYPRYILKNNKVENDWTELVNFIKLVNDTARSEQAFMDALESKFDLDKCLKAWAINNLLGNIDAYNIFYPHNFYFYQDSSQGRWHWISVDGNYSFAAWNSVKNMTQLTNMSVFVPDSVPYQGPRPLLTNTIVKNKLIRKRYVEIVQQLLANDFNAAAMDKRIDSLAMRIRLYVYADTKKMYTNLDFDTNLKTTLGDPLDPGNFIPGLKVFIAERRRHIEAELRQSTKD